MFVVKRIYEEAAAKDGFRVLVDRLWPRGISKERAHLDLWLKEIAPSDDLRRWYHDSKNWVEFKKRYKAELTTKRALIDQLKNLEKEHKQVTLLYSSKNIESNNATALIELLTT